MTATVFSRGAGCDGLSSGAAVITVSPRGKFACAFAIAADRRVSTGDSPPPSSSDSAEATLAALELRGASSAHCLRVLGAGAGAASSPSSSPPPNRNAKKPPDDLRGAMTTAPLLRASISALASS